MKNIKSFFSILLLVAMIFFPSISNCQEYYNKSIDEWDTYWKNNREHPIQMSINPGDNETTINFSWYSKDTDKSSKFILYDETNRVIKVDVKSVNLGNGYVSNKCEVNELKQNTKYYYSYTVNGEYTEKREFETKDKEDFSFILMGDPQIGASYKNKNKSTYEEGIKIDSYNWNNVLETALNKRDNASFIVCVGDETNTKNNYSDKDKEEISKMEFSGFLCPSKLSGIPIANAIGNHDKDNIDFFYHFSNPNMSNLGSTKAGGDYYFTYNDALFLVINTNNLEISEHKKFIEDTVNENINKKWKIAIFHHDIFGCGIHSNEDDINLLRQSLPEILQQNKINIVFNGHDHIYSRSCPPNNKDINSRGIVYLTLGSSTGSKFYKNTDENNSHTLYKFDEKVPTYTIVDITRDSMEINTFRVDSNEKIDESIKIID